MPKKQSVCLSRLVKYNSRYQFQLIDRTIYTFKVHISSAITFAIEGFYPQDSQGFTVTSFQDLYQALPLITLVISMVASSFGMTKFFLQGPLPILPKNSPVNGLISLPFVCMLLMNTMFGVRVLCIENAFFTQYRYERYYSDGSDTFYQTIDPIISPEYRILAYLAPSMVSFTINIIKLVWTGKDFIKYVRQYPQILVACCFTPFMFEGCDVNKKYKLRIWKTGTVMNGLFMGCLPQTVLLAMNFYRGITEWDFLGGVLRGDHIYENNDALIKSPYGNSLFAIISGIIFLFLILFTFFTDKIFKNHGIFCKCCSVICLPCPQNCFNLSNEFSSTLTLNEASCAENDMEEPELDQCYPIESEKESECSGTEIGVYSNGSITWITEPPLSDEAIALQEV